MSLSLTSLSLRFIGLLSSITIPTPVHVLMSLPHNDQNTPAPDSFIVPWPFPPETTLNPPGVHRSSIGNAADGLDPGAFRGQDLVPLGDLSISGEVLPGDDGWFGLQHRRELDPDMLLGQWRDVNPAPAPADELGSSSGRIAGVGSFPAGKEAEPPEEDPDAKKHGHNAKERARRMKLNSSYLNLGALLPDFQTSKKKWTSPGIVDRAFEYIPELQNEIENLTVRRENMLSQTGNTQTITDRNPEPDQQNQVPTVTVHEIRRGEMVLQICAHRRDRDNAQLSSLVRNLEAESLCIVNVSTVSVADNRFYSYQIHIEVDESSVEAHHYNAEAFRDKVISWFGT